MPIPLETVLGNQLWSIVGNNGDVIGVLIIVITGGFALVQPSRLDLKVVIILGGFLIASVFSPLIRVIAALSLAILLFGALMKFFSK